MNLQNSSSIMISGMTKEEIANELESRISADIKHFSGDLPEKYAIAWQGYIAGLYEWKILELGYYRRLSKILPSVGEPNVIAEIFEGRDDDEE